MKAARTPKLLQAHEVKDFMLAGNAILSFQSTETNAYLTYRIVKDEDKDLWYVKTLTRPNNTKDYTYLGTLYVNGLNQVIYRHGKNSPISANAKTSIVIDWAVRRLERPDVLQKILIRHEGYCCKCGKMLTTPESIERGRGPVCAKL